MKITRTSIAALAVIGATACGRSDKDVVAFDTASLDTSVSPCHDFFQYTAGGWIENNPIPGSESRWGKFNQLAKENEEKVRAIFDDLLKQESAAKGSDAQLVGDFYRSGMDSIYIEDLGFTPLDHLMNILHDAPTPEEWFRIAAELKTYGVSMPISIYVGPDDKNANLNILHLSQSGLGLPDRSYYVDTSAKGQELQQKYIGHIQAMFTLYGETPDHSLSIAQSIYNFEKSLAENHWERAKMRNRDLVYNKFTRDSLLQAFEGLPLQTLFDALGISPNEIVVRNPEYLGWLAQAVPDWDIDVLRNYARWHIMNAFAGALHSEVVAQDFDFYGKTLNGTTVNKKRWRRVQGAMGGLSEQIGHLYIDRHFPAEYKAEIETMVEDLRSAFRMRIQNLSWMGNQTKEKALEKLDAFKYKIGYPNEWKDYSDLDIQANDYVGNLMRMSAYKMHENLDRLGKPVDKSEWFMGAHIVNAYYNPSFNEIVFPAGILQPPFYTPGADAAINYGAIGGVIGHEFTHGFDDQGSKYGPDGNMTEWWTEEDRTRFEGLARKVVDQYNQFEALPGEFVNGELTLGENIADHGGLTLAYYAYLHHMEGQPEPEPIDGFTHKQRVFLGWAQVWQGHMTDEALSVRLATDPHSPGKYRVNGPAANLPEFAENFGCDEEGGLILPEEERAIIW